VRRLLGELEEERRALEDLTRPALRGVHQRRRRDDLVDEPEAVALLRRDEPAGQEHAHRVLERDLTRQPMDAAGARDQPDARLGQAEASGVGGDHDVAREGDLEPAAGGHAVDRGDQRLRAVVAAGDRGKP
jgi:hypothetical protein